MDLNRSAESRPFPFHWTKLHELQSNLTAKSLTGVASMRSQVRQIEYPAQRYIERVVFHQVDRELRRFVERVGME